jgi:hypothetical protein
VLLPIGFLGKELIKYVLKDNEKNDLFCGLVVRFHGYRSRGPGLIPGPARVSEK